MIVLLTPCVTTVGPLVFFFNCIYSLLNPVDTTDATFQIRPHKEFNATKGKDRLLSLNRLVDLPTNDQTSLSGSPSRAAGGISRSAYDFMRNRHEETGDPTMRRWNASIRLSNFACIENSPLCVSLFICCHFSTNIPPGSCHLQGLSLTTSPGNKQCMIFMMRAFQDSPFGISRSLLCQLTCLLCGDTKPSGT